jgi:hypothetical protein
LGVFRGFLPVENLPFTTDKAENCNLARLSNFLDNVKALKTEEILIIFADFNYVQKFTFL